MKPVNKEIVLGISDLLPNGEGIAEIDGRRVQVRNALPGELVRARILKKKKGIKFADAIEVVRSSKERADIACKSFPRCGGCSMLHMLPAKEVELKSKKLRTDLKNRNIVFQETLDPVVNNFLHYRRKARLGVKCLGDTVLVGFRESFSSRVARIEACKILTHGLSALIPHLKETISQCSIKQFIPQIEVAEGDQGRAIIVRHLRSFTELDLILWRRFSEEQVVSVYLQSAGYDSMVLLKSDVSESHLGYSLEEQGLFVRFQPEQFVQVNSRINEDLVRTALCFFGDLKNKVIDDYFCGIGNFSLPLARNGALVHGFELSKDSVEMASTNARKNGLSDRAHFSALNLYEKLPTQNRLCDGLLLDPPRSGAGPHFSNWLNSKSCEKIVYVSCNSESLASDSETIVSKGFKPKKIALFNMFPGTSHFETIALYIRE